MTEAGRWEGAVVNDVMRIRLQGGFTLQQWREVLYACRALPGYRADQNSVIDARKARFDFSSADIQALVGGIPKMLEGRGDNFRTAYVVGREVDFGIARMVQMMADKFPFKAETFRTLEEAEAWIALPDSAEQ